MDLTPEMRAALEEMAAEAGMDPHEMHAMLSMANPEMVREMARMSGQLPESSGRAEGLNLARTAKSPVCTNVMLFCFDKRDAGQIADGTVYRTSEEILLILYLSHSYELCI